MSLLPPGDPVSSIAEHRRKIVTQIETAQRLAKENIMRAQQAMKAHYDARSKAPDFVEGGKVWIFTPKKYKGLSKKLLHNYHGPYRIVEKLSPVHYRVRTCTNKPVSSTVHANRMKLFLDPNDRPITPPDIIDDDFPFLSVEDLPDDSFEVARDPPLPPQAPPPQISDSTDRSVSDNPDTTSADLIDNQTVFNAEKILKSRTINGQTQYLIK